MRHLIRNLAEIIKNEITQGKWPSGQPLPSLNELAELHQASRSSINKAMQLLEKEGLVERVQGSGTFVKDQGKTKSRTGELHLGFSYPMSHANPSWIRKAQDKVIQAGGLLTTYDVTSDDQDTEREAQFLHRLSQLGIHGLLAFASPRTPSNKPYYLELLKKGIPVIHLAHYNDVCHDETYFVPDTQQLGFLAVDHLIDMECNALLIVKNYKKVSYEHTHAMGACYSAACQREIPITTAEHFIHRNRKMNLGDSDGFMELNMDILAEIKNKLQKHDGKLGIVFQFYQDALVLLDHLKKEAPECCERVVAFGLSNSDSSVDHFHTHVAHAISPTQNILDEAIDALLKERSSPQKPYLRLFPHKLFKPST